MSESRARRLVRTRSGGVCEMCECHPATEWHHRKNRSQGGEWCPSNGLHLCPRCHRWVTEHPATARDAGGWCVSASAVPAEVPVLHVAFGWSHLRDDGSIHPLSPALDPWAPRPTNPPDKETPS